MDNKIYKLVQIKVETNTENDKTPSQTSTGERNQSLFTKLSTEFPHNLENKITGDFAGFSRSNENEVNITKK